MLYRNMVQYLIFCIFNKGNLFMKRNEYLLGEKLITEDMFIINDLYIDIEFIKYMELGKILSHPDLDADTYAGISDIVKDDSFSSRYTNDSAVVFKSVTNIADFVDSNKQSDDVIIQMSPCFDGSVDFIKNNLIKSNSAKAILKNNTPNHITIDMSQYPNISNRMKSRLIHEYSSIFETPVSILVDDLKTYGDNLLKFDTFYIGEISRFNAATIDYLNNEKFTNKYMFCSKLLPLSKLSNLTEDIIPMTFSNMEIVMLAATKFKFVDPFNCIK